MKRNFSFSSLQVPLRVLMPAVVFCLLVTGSLLPGRVSAATCSPSDTSGCTPANCTSSGGAMQNPYPGSNHPEVCTFTCSPSNIQGCDPTNCRGSGGTWENPYNDSTHPSTCVFSSNTNPGSPNPGSGVTPARPCDSKPTFFGLVPWYQYLSLQPDAAGGCQITNFNEDHVLGSTSPFLLIGLAVLDDLIRLAALVALGFVIFGGIKYVTSQGSPDSTKNAQQTVINALIGLVLALLAAGLVGFIGSKLGS